jgi:hypothetical protein
MFSPSVGRRRLPTSKDYNAPPTSSAQSDRRAASADAYHPHADHGDARRLGIASQRLIWPYRGAGEGALGGNSLNKIIMSVLTCAVLAGCTNHPKTDAELQGEAENAVDQKLNTQATFSLLESVASQDIACGHVSAAEAPGRGQVDQDFVYLHDRLIMDDDPDFDQAAMKCDIAAGGGNSSDLDNATD